MTKCFGIVLIMILSSGCVLLKRDVFYPASLYHERIYSYTSFNTERTAAVGEPMVFKVDGWAGPGFVAREGYQPDPDLRDALEFEPIEPGSEWLTLGRTGRGDLIIRNPDYPRPIREGLPVAWEMCIVVTAGGEPYGYADCRDPAVHRWKRKPDNFLEKKDRIFTKETLRQEFVYYGRANNKLYLSYREYRGTLKIPAVTSSIVLDFWEEQVVTHKGMYIEIHEANDSFIRYSIRTPFEPLDR